MFHTTSEMMRYDKTRMDTSRQVTVAFSALEGSTTYLDKNTLVKFFCQTPSSDRSASPYETLVYYNLDRKCSVSRTTHNHSKPQVTSISFQVEKSVIPAL